MKKLIMVATFAITAVCAQATTVKWGLNGSLDASKFASGTAYLLSADSLAFKTFETESSAQSWYKSNSASLTAASLTTSDKVSSGALSASNVIESPVGDKSYWLLIVNADESYFAVSTSTKTINIASGTMNKTAKWIPSSQMATYSLSSSSIPEPTSAMLLLLGFAGLALKRKRA